MLLIRKLLRYAGVSAISTSVSLIVLTILIGTGSVSAGWANVIATAVGTAPSFELNRRWVWRKAGRRSVAGEVGPFCVLSFVSLGLSTLAVRAAASWAAAHHVSTTDRALIADLASVAAFGTMWVVQYVILDRLLFRSRRLSGTVPAPVFEGFGGPPGDTHLGQAGIDISEVGGRQVVEVSRER